MHLQHHCRAGLMSCAVLRVLTAALGVEEIRAFHRTINAQTAEMLVKHYGVDARRT